jgi:hypothetical protein
MGVRILILMEQDQLIHAILSLFMNLCTSAPLHQCFDRVASETFDLPRIKFSDVGGENAIVHRSPEHS